MLDYKSKSSRKQVAAMLIRVAKMIEEDAEFAKRIFSDMEEESAPKSKKKNRKESEEIGTEVNIFDVYQTQGAEGLYTALESFDVKGVIKIAVDNGLDPARKIRRWRSKEKIMKQIVEIVGKQMSKGEAFMK